MSVWATGAPGSKQGKPNLAVVDHFIPGFRRQGQEDLLSFRQGYIVHKEGRKEEKDNIEEAFNPENIYLTFTEHSQ